MSAVRVRYQTIEFGPVDIHVRSLRDRQEFEDDDGAAEALGVAPSHWPLFGIVWEASQALARLMVDYDIEGRRILEVGCGLGLASLVLNQRGADISATDHHPEAEGFLLANVALNGGEAIPFLRTSWEDGASALGTFDLIIASDLLYERGHAESLASFINHHARPICEVILVDPGRGQMARFGKLMVGFGYSDTPHAAEHPDDVQTPFRGQTRSYCRG